MTKAVLLLMMHSQLPSFTAEATAFMPSDNSRYIAENFTKSGDLLVHQTFLEDKYFVLNKKGEISTIAQTVDGLKCSNIHVSEDGQLHGVARMRDGRTAVFSWQSGSWSQVGSPELYSYTEAFKNESGSFAFYGRKDASSPFSIYLQEDGRLSNISENLRKNGLRIHSLNDDGSMILSSDSQAIQQRTIFRYAEGKLQQLGTFTDNSELLASTIRGTKDVIIGAKVNTFSTGITGSVLLRNGQRIELKSPAGRQLRHVRGNLRSWFVGSEPSNSAGDLSRAVLIVDSKPHYIDDLLENEDELRAKYGFEYVVTETADITPEGVIAVHATVKLRSGNRAPAIFLLKPNI